jgi:hypothetical protein
MRGRCWQMPTSRPHDEARMSRSTTRDPLTMLWQPRNGLPGHRIAHHVSAAGRRTLIGHVGRYRRSLKAVAPVQIRSGLHVPQQVRGLTAGPGGQALIICPSFVRGPRRHRAAAGPGKSHSPAPPEAAGGGRGEHGRPVPAAASRDVLPPESVFVRQAGPAGAPVPVAGVISGVAGWCPQAGLAGAVSSRLLSACAGRSCPQPCG